MHVVHIASLKGSYCMPHLAAAAERARAVAARAVGAMAKAEKGAWCCNGVWQKLLSLCSLTARSGPKIVGQSMSKATVATADPLAACDKQTQLADTLEHANEASVMLD